MFIWKKVVLACFKIEGFAEKHFLSLPSPPPPPPMFLSLSCQISCVQTQTKTHGGACYECKEASQSVYMRKSCPSLLPNLRVLRARVSFLSSPLPRRLELSRLTWSLYNRKRFPMVLKVTRPGGHLATRSSWLQINRPLSKHLVWTNRTENWLKMDLMKMVANRECDQNLISSWSITTWSST